MGEKHTFQSNSSWLLAYFTHLSAWPKLSNLLSILPLVLAKSYIYLNPGYYCASYYMVVHIMHSDIIDCIMCAGTPSGSTPMDTLLQNPWQLSTADRREEGSQHISSFPPRARTYLVAKNRVCNTSKQQVVRTRVTRQVYRCA